MKRILFSFIFIALIGGIYFTFLNSSDQSLEENNLAVNTPDLSTHKNNSNNKTTRIKNNIPSKIDQLRSPSQNDTQVDGKFSVDAQGNLIINASAKDIFDYFLTANGEKSLDAMVNNIKQYIELQLQEPAASQAKAFLRNYLDYESTLNESSQSLQMLMQNSNLSQQAGLEFYQALVANKQQNRDYYFGENAQKLFGDEQAYDEYTLARMQLSNSGLTAQQQQAQLSALKNKLPQGLQTLIQDQHNVSNVEQQLSDLALNNSNQALPQETIDNWTQQHGEEAAQRLAELHQQRQAWQARIEDYRIQREQITANYKNSTQRESAIKALQQRLFSESETLRLKAY